MKISCNILKKHIEKSEDIDFLSIWDKFTIRTAEVEGVEVTVGGAAKTAKKETKKEEVAVDYSKMTVAELKDVAAEKNISVAGMKKAEIIEALSK